jgi:hypothetical protein
VSALDSRAQELYREGRDLFFAGDFDRARVAFQASLDTVDSPNTRMYLGRTLLRLSRRTEAWTALDRAARDADARAITEPRYAPTANAARAEADAIAPSIAWLTIEAPNAPPSLTMSVNNLPLQRAALGIAMAVEPGAIVLEARAEGFRDTQQTLHLDAGARRSATLTLEALPAPPVREASSTTGEPPIVVLPVVQETWMTVPRSPTLRMMGIASMVAGGLTLAAGGVFGVLALNQYEEAQALQSMFGGLPNDDLQRSGARDRDVANVLFVTGGTVAAAGLVMFLLGQRTQRVRVPRLTLSPSAFSVSGSF